MNKAIGTESASLNPHSRAKAFHGIPEAVLLVAFATLAGLAMAPHWGAGAVDLLFLPAVLGAALLGGLYPALLSALLSALAFNYFFTAPQRSFQVDNPADLVTVVVLFLVAVVASRLAASAREQARIAAAHAARNATIAGLARRLLSCRTEAEIAQVTTGQLATLFHCNAVIVKRSSELLVVASAPGPATLAPSDATAAIVTLESGEPAGRAVTRANTAEWQFHPIRAEAAVIAAVGMARDDGAPPIEAGQMALVQNLTDQIALAFERARVEAEARDFAAIRARDRIRSALLSTIAQDLMPGVTTIIDTVDRLRRDGSSDKEVVSEMSGQAWKLRRYISNLADLGLHTDREPVAAGNVTIDLFRRSVSRNGADVHLPPKEYAVLAELAKHPGRVLTHGHLLRAVWGPAQEHQTDYLRVAVRGLRQKLEIDPTRPRLILNEPAVGYRLVAD